MKDKFSSLVGSRDCLDDWSFFEVIGMTCLPIILLVMIYTKNYSLLYVVGGLSLLFLKQPEVLFPTYYAASLSSSFSVIGEGVSAARYLSIIIILSCLICARKKVLSVHDIIIFVIVILFTLISTVLGYDGNTAFFYVMLQNLLVFFLLSLCINLNYEHLTKGLIYVSFLIVILLFLQARSSGAFMFTERYTDDDSINSNNLAMMVAQCSAFMISYSLFGTKTIIRLLSIAATIATILLILATGSRTSLIAISCTLLLAIYFRYGKSNFILKSTVIVVVVFLFLKVSETIMDSSSYVLSRFSYENVAEDGGTGRLANIDIIVNDIMPEHLLFGSGIGGANMKALGRDYNLPNLAHNILIDPLSQMGIIGFILYLTFLFPIISKCKRLIQYREISYLPIFSFLALVTALINGIGETIFYEKFFWNDLGLCVLAYNIIVTNGKIQKIGK